MKKLLVLVAAALLAHGSAQAALATYSDSYGPELTDWNPGKTLSLPKFDSSLGTLNSVSFEFMGSLDATYSAENPLGKAQQIVSHLKGELVFTLPTSADYAIKLVDNESLSIAAHGSQTRTLSDSKTLTDTLLTELSSYIGSGDFNVGVTALANMRMTGSGNVFYNADTFATALVTVTYDYTGSGTSPLAAQAVPEPVSLALVGLALSAAALARRRRG